VRGGSLLHLLDNKKQKNVKRNAVPQT